MWSHAEVKEEPSCQQPQQAVIRSASSLVQLKRRGKEENTGQPSCDDVDRDENDDVNRDRSLY